MSVLGALVWRTNVSTVLQLDIGAVDYHRANFSGRTTISAEFLMWNPDERQSVDIAFNRSALGPAFWKRSTVDLRVQGATNLPSRHVSCAVAFRSRRRESRQEIDAVADTGFHGRRHTL